MTSNTIPTMVTTESARPTEYPHKDQHQQQTPSLPSVSTKPSRPRKPNYAKIHSKPLPITTHPLPTFLPSNPISIFRIAYALLQTYLFSPSPTRDQISTGIFSPQTSSVHITRPDEIRALWEMGFFGKGILSRSEPSWLEREKQRHRKAVGPGASSSEEVTNKRREERRLFKLERARAEREEIERQLLREGKAVKNDREMKTEDPQLQTGSGEDGQFGGSGLAHVFPWLNEVDNMQDTMGTGTHKSRENNGLEERSPRLETHDETEPIQKQTNGEITTMTKSEQDARYLPTQQEASIDAAPRIDVNAADTDADTDITNQEHLQLTPEEAFFLSWGLGVLTVLDPKTSQALSTQDQLSLYLNHATSPPSHPHSPSSITDPSPVAPSADNQFLLNYVVYHHFRSLGWVIRPGSKFAVDYLLYVRGPVFSHAEFAVMIIPAYPSESSNHHGSSDLANGERRDWWWLHCVNRVQTQVRKSLVLCYVRMPSGEELRVAWEKGDIRGVMRLYMVREFVLKRWSANRSRD